jgi:SPP1 family phage portal protein
MIIQADLKNKTELTKDEILDAMKQNKLLTSKYQDNELYYKGENPTILRMVAKETGLPDNRITVPFARKIALNTKNYLFNGPVGYECEDDEHKSRLDEILYINDNESKVQDIGLDLIIHGISYKLFYVDVVGGKSVPRYAIVDQDKGVPIYSIDIEPKLIAFIRYYSVSDLSDSSNQKHYVEVYYDSEIVFYDYMDGTLKETRRAPNQFGAVPAVVYGDEYRVGVFDPVKRLIDALDILVSSDINELQRFEMLYMVLSGDKLPDDPEELKKILQRRIFEISENASMEFLQKNLDATFIMELYDRIIALIHNMSNVPDFMDKNFAAESGIALQYKLIGFEQMAADIESEFLKGEMESLDLISRLEYQLPKYERSTFFSDNPGRMVEIKLPRNLPEDYSKALDDAIKMQSLSIPTETIYKYLPMIKDAAAEVKNSQKEKLKNMELFRQSVTNQEEPSQQEKIDDVQ